jgi:hypothetical protein
MLKTRLRSDGMPNHKLVGFATALSLIQHFPASADVFPVTGVWVAPNPDFPIAIDEACFTIKTFGIEAVVRKSIPEMIIFANDKRYKVKGNSHIGSTVPSVKAADGGFWITEIPDVRRRFWFRPKVSYFLTIIDAMTIEIRDNAHRTRFAKCVPQGKPRI